MLKCLNPITVLGVECGRSQNAYGKEKDSGEREKQLKEAAKESTSLQSWLQRSKAAGETETLHCDKDDNVQAN